MMKNQFSQVKWGRVLLTSIVVFALSYCTIFLVITAYGFILAFQARGAPDQARIQEFAGQVSPWGGPVVTVLLTFIAGIWVARKVKAVNSLQGLLVGLMVAVIGVIVSFISSQGMGLLDFMWFILIVVAGWFGGSLAGRRR